MYCEQQLAYCQNIGVNVKCTLLRVFGQDCFDGLDMHEWTLGLVMAFVGRPIV